MLEEARVRRRWKKLYRAALKAGLADLGIRLRNDLARHIESGETIIEDDAVLIGNAEGLRAPGSGRGIWGWMVITSRQAVWSPLSDKSRTAVLLSDLDLVFTEGALDTYRWSVETNRWRKTETTTRSVTFGFPKKSEIRDLLYRYVNDQRHDDAAESGEPES